MDRIKKILFEVLQRAMLPLARYTEKNLVFFGYQGSTQLSSIANPPRCITLTNMFGQRSTSVLSSSKIRGQNVWLYNTTDGATEMTSAAYFTDAYYLGMKEGDIVMGAVDTGSSISMYAGVMGAVTTAGGAIASSGGLLSSTR